MDRTKVMELADKAGGLFRLTVLLQKRVRELVNGARPLIETEETNPINIAMREVEEDAIELVDLSEEELKVLEAESQMASEEAEILEALRTRVTTDGKAGKPAPAAKPKAGAAPAPAAKPKAEAAPAASAKAEPVPEPEPEPEAAPADDAAKD